MSDPADSIHTGPRHDPPEGGDLAHVVITGGAGYVGRSLTALAISRGLTVTVLGRHVGDLPAGACFVSWQLGDALPAEVLSGSERRRTALIHLAHDWTNAPIADGTYGVTLNEAGTVELWRSARAAGLSRLVFVSSQSARQDAINLYGRTKWSIEQRVMGNDTALARVGLVYGGAASGLFALMLRLASLPILPMVVPGQPVQPIHVDEVAAALLALARGRARTIARPFNLAADQTVTFGELLKTLAREAYGRSLTIIPLPLSLALLGCRLTSLVPFVPTVDRERVLGLVGVRVMSDCARDAADLGVTVMPIVDKLRSSLLARRALLVEARTIIGFVLGQPPSMGLQRRYVRHLQSDSVAAGPLALSRIAVRWPGALTFEQTLRGTSALDRRIDMAAALAEVSPDGARAFYESTRSEKMFKLAKLLLLEIPAFPFRLLTTLRASRRP